MGKLDIDVIETYWKSVCKSTHYIGKSFPKDDFRYWNIDDFQIIYSHAEDSNGPEDHILQNKEDLEENQIKAFFEWIDSENEITGENPGMAYLGYR